MPCNGVTSIFHQIPETAMILDDHLFIMRKKSWTIQHIDWIFSLFGFLFLVISVCSGFFVPNKTIDISLFGTYINSYIFEIFFWVSILFFTFGCVYALLNRILKFPTPWKLTMLHFNATLFSVIFLLIKLFSDTSVVQMNSLHIFNSLLFLSLIFVIAQFLFVVTAAVGFVRKFVY